MKKLIVPISAACMLALGSAGTVWAQAGGAAPAQQPPTQQAPTQTTPADTAQPAAAAPMAQASDFTDQEVAQFAQANRKVQDIQTDYTGRLQEAAGDQEKVAEVQEEAQEKMVQAVEETGLGVDKYNQILQVAQADPALVERIEAQR